MKRHRLAHMLKVAPDQITNPLPINMSNEIQFMRFKQYGPKTKSTEKKKSSVPTPQKIMDFWKKNPFANDLSIMTEFPVTISQLHIMKNIYKFQPKPNDNRSKRQVFWLYGPSDHGKSTMVKQNVAELGLSHYKMLNATDFKWYDDYQFERVLEMPEVGLDRFPPICALKDLCDVSPTRVERKGSTVHIRPLVVFITSQHSLERVYQKQYEADKMVRNRIYSYPVPHCTDDGYEEIKAEIIALIKTFL